MTSLKLFFLIKISYNYLLHIFQVEAFHSTKLAFPSVRIRVSIPLDLHVKNLALGLFDQPLTLKVYIYSNYNLCRYGGLA